MKFRIKEARENVGLSQKDLAAKLNIKPTTFNGYETGAHDPKSDVLAEIAKACDTSVDFLLGLQPQIRTTKNSPAPAEPETGERDTESQDLLESLVHSFDSLNMAGKRQLSEYAGMLLKEEKYAAEYPEAGKKFA